MVQAHCELLPLTKVLLHAAKHPANTVNGVLVGTLQEQQQQPQGEEGRPQQDVNITDAIPLFHSSTNLAGPVEVALAQVRAAMPFTAGSGCFAACFPISMLRVHCRWRPCCSSKAGGFR